MPTFAEIIAPSTLEEFETGYFDRQPLVAHGPLDRWPDVAASPELRSAEGYFASAHHNDRINVFSIPPLYMASADHARRGFQAGYSINVTISSAPETSSV